MLQAGRKKFILFVKIFRGLFDDFPCSKILQYYVIGTGCRPIKQQKRIIVAKNRKLLMLVFNQFLRLKQN
jgi:hypothetical protein